MSVAFVFIFVYFYDQNFLALFLLVNKPHLKQCKHIASVFAILQLHDSCCLCVIPAVIQAKTREVCFHI